MMTLQEIEKEIRQAIPEAGVVSITHQLTTNNVGEIWNINVYAIGRGPGEHESADSVLIAGSDHLCKSPQEALFSLTKNHIRTLQNKLAKLGGCPL